MSQFDYHTIDDLFAGIGAGKCSIIQVVNKVSEILEEGSPEAIAQAAREREKQAAKRSGHFKTNRLPRHMLSHVLLGELGINGITVALSLRATLIFWFTAHCCNPVAGDDIIGFVTRGRGVSVHREPVQMYRIS